MIGQEYGEFDLTATVVLLHSPAQVVDFYALTHQVYCDEFHFKLPSVSGYKHSLLLSSPPGPTQFSSLLNLEALPSKQQLQTRRILFELLLMLH